MAALRNQQIELARLEIHPNNVRGDQDYDDDGIRALAANIEEFGLFQIWWCSRSMGAASACSAAAAA